MSGDYSRERFDPHLDYTGVLMQQGRVQLDADWNEWAAILDRRLRAETADLVAGDVNPDVQGIAVYPRLTPDAFRIEVSGSALRIGRGRMYIDGLLAENHGAGDLEFDRLLAEQRHVDPIPYNAQPYHPTAPALPEVGRGLAYLEVWQREVTHLEAPDLVEVAVGVDTTTRTQTVWQVRYLDGVDAAVDCETPDAQIEGWPALIRPSAGRLTTRAVGVPPEDDPCEMPPGGGFRGLENQLYRVEIHDGGGIGAATFKWSRDNGAVATGVAEVLSAHELRLDTLGRDSVLRFNNGDWVEIIDDRRALSGRNGDPALRHGDIRQITVDEDAQTITFTPDLTDLVPSGVGDDTIEARHLIVRRWDQRRTVLDSEGDTFINLDDTGAGVIPVPPPGTTLVLEAGIEVSFALSAQDGVGGGFYSGDYWTFAARTATASVEELTEAPPRGPHHHFARLAVVTMPGAATDCRTAWPPEASGDTCCDCTICISADEFEAHPDLLQRAVDELRERGGSICLSAGQFLLRDAVRLEGARGIEIRGQGPATELAAPAGAFAIIECADIAISAMSIVTLGRSDEPVIGAAQALGLRLERLQLTKKDDANAQPAIGLARVVADLEVRGSTIAGPACIGIWRREGEDPYLSLQGAVIEQNALTGVACALDLGGRVVHRGVTRIDGNSVRGAREAGFRLTGAMLDQFGIDVMHNTIDVAGDAIVAGVDGARIEANEVMNSRTRGGGRGIVLAPGFAGAAVDRTMILENRISGLAGAAIAIEAELGSCLIKNNIIRGCGEGIVFESKGAADAIAIENNHLLDIAATLNEERSAPTAIRVLRGRHVDVTGNVIEGVGVENVQGILRAGIIAVACERIRIANNEVGQVGPAGQFVGSAAAIEVARPFRQATITGNSLRREVDPNGIRAPWSGIVVGGELERDVQRINSDSFLLRVDETRYILGTRDSAVTVAVSAEDVTVQGNTIEASSGAPAVAVLTRGEVLVADNRCAQAESSPGVVVLAQAGIVSGNRVQGGEPSMALSLDPKLSTILGNVTSNPIQMPGGLGAPWAALNVHS